MRAKIRMFRGYIFHMHVAVEAARYAFGWPYLISKYYCSGKVRKAIIDDLPFSPW